MSASRNPRSSELPAASNVVAAIADSALFLWLAFGTIGAQLFQGQVAGKLLMTAAALPVVFLARKRLAVSTP